ncbi:MAG: TonB-dependent receptor, partial [Alkalimonas sp.]|nr:TonB-dependent receptor [Alkalimonas sp.]
MHVRTLTAITSLPLFFSYPLLATEQNTEQPEVIVVTAYQQPSRWLTTAAGIGQSQTTAWQLPQDSARLFDGLPGLQADSRTNYAQDTRLSIRGFGSRSAFGVRGLYLTLDGIPLTNPDGQSQVSSLQLSQIGSVEVLRGPLASLYGNASGGVIQLLSQPITDNSISLSSAHSARSQQWDADLQWQQADHQLRLAAHRFEHDGFRVQSSATKQQALLDWRWQFKPGLVSRLRVDWSYDPSLLDPQGISPDDWRTDPSQTHPAAQLFDTRKQSRQLQLAWQLQPEHGDWQFSSWRTEREINQNLAFAGDAITSSGGEILLQRTAIGLNAWHRWQLQHDLTLTLGSQLEQSTDRRFGFINDRGQRGDLRRDEEGQVTRSDLYLRSQWDPTEQWHVIAGVRASQLNFQVDDYFIVPGNPDDSGEKRFREQSWALGSSYLLRPNLSIYLSTGQGFETPTLTEMAYQNEGTGLNLALQAAQNQQWELGLKWLPSAQTRFDATLFHINTRNELVVDTSFGGRTSFRNAAETKRQGLEIQLDWQQHPSLSHRFSAHWLSAHYRGDVLDGQ